MITPCFGYHKLDNTIMDSTLKTKLCIHKNEVKKSAVCPRLIKNGVFDLKILPLENSVLPPF